MNPQKLCFIDTETTGVDRKRCHIFQVSALLVDHDTMEIEDRISLKFTPHSMEYCEEGAFHITGTTREGLEALPLKSHEAFSEFNSWCGKHVNRYDKKDKMTFVAYNAPFDYEFMREWFQHNGDNFFGSLFWHPPVCVMAAAAWYTQRVRVALPNFKLETLCRCAEIGWEEESAHDADYDIISTHKLYCYLRQNLSGL